MTERAYEVYCGNLDCPTREVDHRFVVFDHELADGELWLCPRCRQLRPAKEEGEHPTRLSS